MIDINKRAEHCRVRAHRKARAHYLTAKRANRMHTLLGVPVVVTSTIVGTSIFATLSVTPVVAWQIVTGLLAISAAVLAALQTFFKYSELAEKHRVAAAHAAIKRRLDVFVLKAGETLEGNEELFGTLEVILNDLSQLEADSPDIPDRFYDQAAQEQKADHDGI